MNFCRQQYSYKDSSSRWSTRPGIGNCNLDRNFRSTGPALNDVVGCQTSRANGQLRCYTWAKFRLLGVTSCVKDVVGIETERGPWNAGAIRGRVLVYPVNPL